MSTRIALRRMATKEREVPACGGEEKAPGFVREKRVPVKQSLRPCDIYVTRSSSFVSQLQRCRHLLAKGMNEIHVHAIGPAMVRAINLALTLAEESAGTLAVSPTTSTVRLVDDVVPVDDEGMPRSEKRANSAIDIRIFKLDSEAYVRLHAPALVGAAERAAEGSDADVSAGKSKKRKRNRAAASRRDGDGGREAKGVNLDRVRAVAKESKAAAAEISGRPS